MGSSGFAWPGPTPAGILVLWPPLHLGQLLSLPVTTGPPHSNSLATPASGPADPRVAFPSLTEAGDRISGAHPRVTTIDLGWRYRGSPWNGHWCLVRIWALYGTRVVTMQGHVILVWPLHCGVSCNCPVSVSLMRHGDDSAIAQ